AGGGGRGGAFFWHPASNIIHERTTATTVTFRSPGITSPTLGSESTLLSRRRDKRTGDPHEGSRLVAHSKSGRVVGVSLVYARVRESRLLRTLRIPLEELPAEVEAVPHPAPAAFARRLHLRVCLTRGTQSRHDAGRPNCPPQQAAPT